MKQGVSGYLSQGQRGEHSYEPVHQQLLDYRDYDSTTETMEEIFLDAVGSLIFQGEIDKNVLERESNAR